MSCVNKETRGGKIMGLIGKLMKYRIAKEVGKKVMDYIKSDKGGDNPNKENPNRK